MPFLWAADPFGLDPGLFAGAVLLGLLGLMLARTLGWTASVPGLEELLWRVDRDAVSTPDPPGP